MNTKDAGNLGEDYAVAVLKAQGYTILDRNFRLKMGEIDIIATKGDIIAFVEVKLRKSGAVATGFDAVDAKKQKKIIKTALFYMQRNNLDLQPRFDVISVVTKQNAIISFDFLEGAYDGSAY